jgi:hypothetical protein
MSLKASITVTVAAAALAVAVAPPFASAHALSAYSQVELQNHRDVNHSNPKTVPGTFTLASSLRGVQVYQARGAQTPIVRAPNGRGLGTDPAPAIRGELRRDWLAGADEQLPRSTIFANIHVNPGRTQTSSGLRDEATPSNAKQNLFRL